MQACGQATSLLLKIVQPGADENANSDNIARNILPATEVSGLTQFP